jgi:hypothetical protein
MEINYLIDKLIIELTEKSTNGIVSLDIINEVLNSKKVITSDELIDKLLLDSPLEGVVLTVGSYSSSDGMYYGPCAAGISFVWEGNQYYLCQDDFDIITCNDEYEYPLDDNKVIDDDNDDAIITEIPCLDLLKQIVETYFDELAHANFFEYDDMLVHFGKTDNIKITNENWR